MITLSKREEKLIASLKFKKFRIREQLFLVEGEKMISEALNSKFHVRMIVSSHNNHPFDSSSNFKQCSPQTMQRLTSFKSPPGLLAVIELPKNTETVSESLILVIEKVQDPGNFGTIIRTADGLGIRTIICSEDCADIYSSKVVQASMGSIFRVNIQEENLPEYLSHKLKNYTVYAAHLDGKNIYQQALKIPSALIVGNESQGISEELMAYVNQPLKIPIEGEVESFNVGIATAIILSEFRRQLFL